ncbi:Citrate transporter [Tistlia consotensis]|uniref:Citrate transporter n=1 Tax=Tistlia consotensis USBA 355 TaxID=560819 RepID=A0A1Y6CWP9_9PROT|nr:SLC13 family permease [Tistlia consotensis]SMF83952.1 Citrate transporter [Tistlia consotensis USBA 355]SNS35143.1 Citrate transporter [Tistlia consotensis]
MSLDTAGSLTFDQGAILLLLAVLMAVFALDRFRIELVALAGLAAGFALGLAPAAGVFSGFSNPAVVTVAEILLVIQALARSRIVEHLSTQVTRLVKGEGAALAFLCGVAGALSVFMNNVGALALVLPVAISLSGRLGIPIRRTLMPVSFATLLGGLCSLIGTPANLVVNQARVELLGRPFAFFDLAYVGIPVAVLGILFLIAWAPRQFRFWAPGEPREQGIRQRRLVTEVRIPRPSPFPGQEVSALEAALDARVFALVRDGRHVFGRLGEQRLEPADVLVLELPTDTLEDARAAETLELATVDGPAVANSATVDVVLMPQSIFVGSRVGTLHPLATRGVTVAGVVPQRSRVEGRLADLQLGIGDVLVLSGPEKAIEEVLDEADLLRLSSRPAAAPKEHSLVAVAIFALGVLLAAFSIFPPQIAFGFAVLALSATGSLRLREALQNLNWPILVMLAAMIPLGVAVETTGAARVLSQLLLELVPGREPVLVLGCVLLVAVALTPFVNNVSTAVILSPIAVEVARGASLPAGPFLIAVALGASLDFLTPFGHHNNTLVMGMAGYRFVDFPRLGGPLLLVTFAAGLLGIWLVWL